MSHMYYHMMLFLVEYIGSLLSLKEGLFLWCSLSYWRSPSYNLTRLLLTLAICIFYGTMFLGRGRLPTDGARARPLAPTPCPTP